MTRETADVVVIGAGFAGAATAAHLARLGLRRVVLLEQEAVPGAHASGLNAGMARQVAVSPAIAPLAREGTAFLRRPPEDWRLPPLLRSCGLLVLAEGDEAEALRASCAAGGEPDALWLSREEVERLVPVTAGGAFAGGLLGRGDGVVDIAALLQGYLRIATEGGARVLTGRRALRVRGRNGRVEAVETDEATFVTAAVVNAAGPWAGAVAAAAGASPVPLRACRRHLFSTAPLPWVDPSWPIVWDGAHGFYFRPEPPGLLLSPCDEVEHAPGFVAPDPSARELLAAKLLRCLPRLRDVPLARAWAGLRTLTRDGNFVLGRDPQLAGFVWCAGLGGHGMTVSFAAGRLAAEAVLGRPPSKDHAPERWLTVAQRA